MIPLLKNETSLIEHPLQIIRIETALSRFPIHLLVKTEAESIEIVRRGERGEVQLLWEVSFNRKYGPPRQLAYRLDTLIINRRIEEAGRPLPRLLRLGSLNELCEELGGSNKADLKQAFRQNATTSITAKLHYKLTNGEERRLEATFNRYCVYFTGETLPGREQKADAVYIGLSEPYWEVLNGAQVRPLDYEYLRELTPTAQRCYEIISYKIYTALKYKHQAARINYSDYCTYSAQTRYLDYNQVKKQMYKVHLPHLRSGYLTGVKFEQTQDKEAPPDWQMIYTPGLRAHKEFLQFSRKNPQSAREAEYVQRTTATISTKEERRREREWPPFASESALGGSNEALLEALTSRGIVAEQARLLVAQLKEGQDVLAQLAYGDNVIAQSKSGAFHNPAGFYIYLIKSNIAPPDSFMAPVGNVVEKELEEKTLEAASEIFTSIQKRAYQNYRDEQLDRFIKDSLRDEEREALKETIRGRLLAEYPEMPEWPQEMVEHTLHGLLRNEVKDRVAVLDITAYLMQPEVVEGKGARRCTQSP